MCLVQNNKCPSGGNGIHNRFKISRWKRHTGSSPVSGTIGSNSNILKHLTTTQTSFKEPSNNKKLKDVLINV